MTTKAASEGALGELHCKVAKVMAKALEVTEVAQERYLAAESDDIGPAPEVSAPLLGVITKFLNDNKISCAPEDSAELSELEQRLANKRQKKRRTVGNVVQLIDEDD